MGSRQFLEEWQAYKNILDDSKITEKTTWLDVRGNHGNNDFKIIITKLFTEVAKALFCTCKKTAFIKKIL